MTDATAKPELPEDRSDPHSLRRRAEAHLQGSAPESHHRRTGEDDDMPHELRVHQIELEMQNEELRRAQADLEASRARYFDLYDLAPVGYCTLDEAGIIREVNLTAARMFEVAKGQVIGKPLTDFIDRDSQDVFYHQRQQLPDMLAPRAFELQFRRSSSGSFWGWVEIHAFRDAEGALSRRVAFTDITLLKQKEADRKRHDG